DLREQTALVQELRRLEAGDPDSEIAALRADDGLEERQGELAPDHRRSLEQFLLLRPQTIDAGGQHRLTGGGPPEYRERPGQVERAPLPDHDLRLDQGPHALL